MAKLTSMPSLEIIDGFKGVVDFYEYLGIPVARRWPRSPDQPRSLAVQAQWPLFAEVQHGWKPLTAEIKEAYAAMAEGTDYTSRDMFTVSVISGLDFRGV
ncbi:hypothetical protein ES708_17038 [subsurface metagenome]